MLNRLYVGTFTAPSTPSSNTTPTSACKDLLAKLAIPVPSQSLDLQPRTPLTSKHTPV